MCKECSSDAQAIIEATRETMVPAEVEPGKIYSVPNGQGGIAFADTYAWADSPLRVQRDSEVTDVASFITYLKTRNWPDLSTPNTEVWANQETLSIVAILDGCGICDGKPLNGWMQDRVVLTLDSSPEWDAFLRISGLKMGQNDFAEFLQDWESCIVEPESAKLLEIVQSMSGSTKVQWDSVQWLANGQRGFGWHEETEAKAGRKGDLDIPAVFVLGLRPFLGSDPYKVRALLRYQIKDGVLLIGLKLVEPQRIVEAAFGDVVAQIRDQVGGQFMMGRP